MALAGLANLAAVEPGLAILESGEKVTLSLGADPFYSFDKPAGKGADDWANAISKALIAAHLRSGQLQRTDPQRIYDSYMTGVAGALGDDSRYYPSEEFYGYLEANFDGLVDLTYAKTEGGLRVLSLDHTGRLAAAGLKAGDIITHVDGKATAPLSQFEVYSLLRGPEGSKVSLNLLRDGEALPASIAVLRWKIAPRSYELSRIGGIAVYKLPVLNEFAANELASSLSGKPLTGLLLDLRGEPGEAAGAVSSPSVTFGTSRLDWSNVVGYIDFGFMSGPGGSPDAARRLATAFMSDGVIFRRRGRQDTANAVIEAGGFNPSGRLPLVVLVDAYTIGGAEMATAALQDSGRALVIGASTAGSGTIRRNVSLYNLGVINLPWAQAYAPSGYGIEGRGVMPNVCTTRPGITLDAVLAGLRRGEGMIGEEARGRVIAPDDAAGIAAHRALCPAVPDTGGLAHDLGMAILQDPALYARLMQQGAGS
jgi:carboxyl-terminal processing protease